jgi:malonyl CoA-acyl carrier protein transacylase
MKPIEHGMLNIRNNSPEEVQECLNDIERLLKYMLK